MSYFTLLRRIAPLSLAPLAVVALAASAPGCASPTGGTSADAGHADARPLADAGGIDAGARDAAPSDAGVDAVVPLDGGRGDACVPGAACDTGDPCTTGATDCSSGQAVCAETGSSPAGTSCPEGTCDGAGHCVVCTPGAACTPAEACHVGTTTCTQGVATCVAGDLSPAGTTCSGGTCDAAGHCGCVAGSACDPSEECRTGTSACGPDGVVMCTATGNEPAGTACTGGVCDGAGSCVPCVAGEACTPPSACDSGRIECTSGAPVCVVASHLPAGVSCPTGVCDGSGTCNACTAGAPCTTSNPCTTATIDCSTGAPVCNVVGNVAAGTSCPSGVCSGTGTCVPCAAGASCSTGDPCTTGSLACSTGAPVCTVSGNAPAGTSCPGGVCNGSGACNPCAAGMSCPTGNPCTTGAIACGSGAPMCVVSGNLPAGTSCPGGVCNGSGTCTSCTAGASCGTGNPCTTGAIACGSGAPMCTVSGNLPAGTSCPGGVCNGSGTCNPCSAGTACSTGNACTTGAIQCSSGTSTCGFSGNVPAGTPCPGGACNGSGTCLASCAGTPWGTVPSGYSNVAYQSSTPSGACAAETRTCTNGTLSGSFTATSCTPGCTGTPWGDVPNGYSNTAYLSASPGGPCYGQTRTCSSGTLSGSYTAASCTPGPSPACRITLTAGGLGGGGPPGGPYSVSLGWGVSVANTYGLSACGVTVSPSESGLSSYSGPVYSFAAGASGGEGPFKNVSTSSLPYSVGISASSVVCPAGTSQVPGPTSSSCAMTLQSNGTQVNACSSMVTIDCR